MAKQRRMIYINADDLSKIIRATLQRVNFSGLRSEFRCSHCSASISMNKLNALRDGGYFHEDDDVAAKMEHSEGCPLKIALDLQRKIKED